MLFTKFLDSIEGTEDEAKLMEQIAKFKGEIAEASEIPFVGKAITALIALEEMGNVTVFKDSPHYRHLEGWDCSINLESGEFSLYPGAAQRKTILTIVGAIFATIFLFVMYRKMKKRRNK